MYRNLEYPTNLQLAKFQNISSIFMHHQHQQKASVTREHDLTDKRHSLSSYPHLDKTDMDHKQELTALHEVRHHAKPAPPNPDMALTLSTCDTDRNRVDDLTLPPGWKEKMDS